MSTAFKLIILFLAITGLTVVLGDFLNIELGKENFWNHHGVFFLFFITLFPRLTLLFSSVAFGGVLWWLGFIFTPRFLVAILATISYWRTNPLLVTLSWVICLSGESGEKYVITKKVHSYKRTHHDVIDVNYEKF